MFGFHALVLSRELTRDQLPRVIRPFWAASRLRDAWSSPGSRHRLLDAYERLAGFAPPEDDHALLRTLERALESGRLIMLDWQEVTFDPVASGRADTLKLHPPAGQEPPGFDRLLEQALHRRGGGSRRQLQPEPAAPASRPLTFEESVAANKKFFGQPVSRVAAKETAPPPPRPEPLVLHFEMDIHAPASRNDRFTLRTQDGAWSQTIEMQSMQYVQDHWLELVFEDAPPDGRFELIQHPSEPGRTPFFVFRHLSYTDLSEPAAEQAAVA